MILITLKSVETNMINVFIAGLDENYEYVKKYK